MIAYPHLDPVMLQIGPLALRWYGMMYTLSFLLAWPLITHRAQRFLPRLTADGVGDLMVWLIVGVVLGGRLGYVIFYKPAVYLAAPLDIIKVWEGGMSFHGGFMGCLLAGWWFSRKQGLSFLEVTDLAAPAVPVGLFFGRIGNFINGELWGRMSDVPWAMVFPNAGPVPRHPSQLYEAALEGLLLFAVLMFLGRKAQPPGFLIGVFIAGYGLSRFVVEFAREPDAHLGLLSLGLSMGQWLSLPMVFLGFGLSLWAPRRHAAG
ncbi:MAG: prolipoprotein diacylglyceryl transferase [Magnetococcales bacterium]|nr:prolipoprotein diacylglyceryl transferase [Magnetococcales bacterium]